VRLHIKREKISHYIPPYDPDDYYYPTIKPWRPIPWRRRIDPWVPQPYQPWITWTWTSSGGGGHSSLTSCQNSSFYCNSSQNLSSTYDSSNNDESTYDELSGITSPGSRSDQKFERVNDFETDSLTIIGVTLKPKKKETTDAVSITITDPMIKKMGNKNYCPFCGKYISSTDFLYCPSCGKKIK
jgi:hypothetical protein